MTDPTTPSNAKKWWRPTWRTLALWFVLWLPWLYLGVFAYTAKNTVSRINGIAEIRQREFGWPFPSLKLQWVLSGPSWPPTPTDILFFHKPQLAANLFVSVVIATVFTFVIATWIGVIRRNGFRFRISTLLGLVVVVSIPLAVWRYVEDEYEHETAIKVALTDLHVGLFYFSYDVPLLVRRLERFLPDHASDIWKPPRIAMFGYDSDLKKLQNIVALLQQLKHLDKIRIAGEVDPILSTIHTLPNVRTLHLYKAKVTDSGLEHLLMCPWLETIEFEITPVSEGTLRKLRAALPDTEIIYDGEEMSE